MIQPYSDPAPHCWQRSRLNLLTEPQFINVVLDSWDAITVQRTGRVRVIIEGEEELVQELLGKNFMRRMKRVAARINEDAPGAGP